MAPKPVASRGALPLALSAALAWSALPGGAAEAVEFDEADIFLELNATDGDLGVHVSIDAESWRELRIQGPGGQRIVEVAPRGNLARIGLTELFLEGEEPSLEEVPFARFLTQIPPGTYTFLGRTVEGEPLRSTDPLTAWLPCPVEIVSPPEDGTVPAAGLVGHCRLTSSGSRASVAISRARTTRRPATTSCGVAGRGSWTSGLGSDLFRTTCG